ncbi:hypothetical protein P7C70_g8674, partial [Phenoliferia sp. Uapishka_3]
MAPSSRPTQNDLLLTTVRPFGPSHLLPIGTAPGTKVVRLEFKSQLALDAWIAEQRTVVKWNRDRGQADPNAARKRRKEQTARNENTPPIPTPRPRAHPYLPPPPPRASPYDSSERYECDHAGKPRSILAPADRQRKARTSIKVGCKAHFFVRKLKGKEEYVVDLHLEHTGHIAATVESMRESRMSDATRGWLQGMVERGLDWPAIKNLLRPSEEVLQKVEACHENGVPLDELPEAFRVGWQEAYNVIRKRLRDLSRLAPDGWESLVRWKAKLEGEGWDVLLKADVFDDDPERKVYAVGVISPWQKKILAAHQDLVCLDSTHHTCFSVDGADEKAFLYTLVVKYPLVGKGIPVAFLITVAETRYPIIDWFWWLKRDVFQDQRFYPRAFMIDCSDTEAAAISTVFPNSSTFWCYFHMLKAVRQNAVKKLSVIAFPDESKADLIARNKQLRALAFSDVVRLIEQPTEEAFDEQWENIGRTYALFPGWISYLNKQWVSHRERWGRAWRQVRSSFTLHSSYLTSIPLQDIFQSINTNNFIESWHRILKSLYLKLMRRQRDDYLLFLLFDSVLPDYRRMVSRIVLGFESRRLDKAEASRRAKAYSPTPAEALELIVREEQDSVIVRSFSSAEDVTYAVLIAKEHIISCTCPDSIIRKHICKHMWLVDRLLLYSISFGVPRAEGPAPDVRMADPAAPIPAARREVQVLGLLDRVQDEREKVGDVLEQFAAMSLEEKGKLDPVALETAHSHLQSARRALGGIGRAVYALQRK